MSACGEHYALYCDVCQTFWPAHREPATRNQELQQAAGKVA
jgi:hypothetical protein